MTQGEAIGDVNEANGTAALRILIVEDEFLVADHIAYTLEQLGYEVVGPVATIAEAMTLIEDQRIDGALLDANLDGASSAPIADALNARAVPFVVCTGYGSLKLSAEVLDVAPRVTKPYSRHQFAETLTAAFAVH